MPSQGHTRQEDMAILIYKKFNGLLDEKYGFLTGDTPLVCTLPQKRMSRLYRIGSIRFSKIYSNTFAVVNVMIVP